MRYIVHQLAKHPTKRYGKRQLSQIKRIVIHHFAGNISIQEAAKYHVSKGWSGIGYTVVIDDRGDAYTTNDLDTVSYGVANMNTSCLSIALQGDFSNQLPDQHVLRSMHLTIGILRGLLGPLPVKVHSDYVNTECPGSALRNYIRAHYPEPEALEVPLSWFARMWRKIWKDGDDHL